MTARKEHMPQPIAIVDAFTDVAFKGNPAGVCVLPRERDDEWMRNVAMEMNQAETAFVHRRDDGDWNLRWFTPTIEVDLCGHATLASAHTLWEAKHLAPHEPARFRTKSGLLTCTCGQDELIEMDFPSTPPGKGDIDIDAAELSRMLGVARDDVAAIARTKFDVFVELQSEQKVQGARPDFAALGKVAGRGVIVTAPSSGPRFDFVSRFFAPQVGVNEDPATGSSHCALGPFWSERLGKERLTGHQISRRGGVIHVIVRGDRVVIGGRAVTMLRGELSI